MLDSDLYDTINRLLRKARSIHLEAGRAAPLLASQLRSLAASYEAEAQQLGGRSDTRRRRGLDS
jgi:hypothetical protein